MVPRLMRQLKLKSVLLGEVEEFIYCDEGVKERSSERGPLWNSRNSSLKAFHEPNQDRDLPRAHWAQLGNDYASSFLVTSSLRSVGLA